jgi:hypothetical protein
VTGCTFTGNTAEGGDSTGSGGGMCNNGASPTVTNCTFTDNMATYGSGMEGGGTMTNCILWGDSTAANGTEVYSVNATFNNCDIQGSGGSTDWNPALGIDGGGNIMANPQFVNSANPIGSGWFTTGAGLALQSTSHCINAGTATGAPPTDILDKSWGGVPDIGAYQYYLPSVTPTPTPTPMPSNISAPGGQMAITFMVTTPSIAQIGGMILYIYVWTSDQGDSVTHGPTSAASDTLIEMNLVKAGETWTVTVTPSLNGSAGPSTSAKVKILNPQSGVAIWTFYK